MAPQAEGGSRARAGTGSVVVTGASAGIGRAVACALGARGASVGLLARGEVGLEAAAKEVEQLGGAALAVPTDVANPEAVAAAADAVEAALGPIEVWVNVAFCSVFAPFSEISAEEFARVTEVSYLGYVNGTRTALEHMRPRGRGTIVQVGSALSERSIPLQSAYCGAKHAINGFTSSLRCELLHEHSAIKVTVVQMPAVNTPQFSWVRSRLPDDPQPVPPIYQPEVAARAVLAAIDHPERRQYRAGGSTVATLVANKFVPGLLDRYLGRTGWKSQQTGQAADPNRADNLWSPLDGAGGRDFGMHGSFDARAHSRSAEVVLSAHSRAATTAAGLLACVAAGATWRAVGRSPR